MIYKKLGQDPSNHHDDSEVIGVIAEGYGIGGDRHGRSVYGNRG